MGPRLRGDDEFGWIVVDGAKWPAITGDCSLPGYSGDNFA